MSFNKYPTEITEYKPMYYTISITKVGGDADAGFIDHKTPSWYINDNNVPTKDEALAIIKGNMRYDRLMLKISEYATITNISEITEDDDEYSFVVGFERNSDIYTYSDSGVLITDVLEALELQVTRAFSESITQSMIVYDPTETGSPAFARDPSKLEIVIAESIDVEVNVTAILVNDNENRLN